MAYLIDAARTPFGKHKGGLAGVRARGGRVHRPSR